MRRNVNIFRLFGNLYIALILGWIGYCYYVFMISYTIMTEEKNAGVIVHMVLMNLNIFMLLWSFMQTIISDPGKVPLFWGFFLDDPDHKRRRYCLICHIFKPERSHHCSACNRCVLNMDHHCPWLNNCIGFYNRKFFLLLLFYAIVTLLEMFGYYMPIWIKTLIYMSDNAGHVKADPYYLLVITYILNMGMTIVVIMFFRFHLQLVSDNMTTIEHMDKKRSANEPKGDAETVNYNMGIYYNFVQIFGRNPWLWFVPVFLTSGKPVGDGVVWPQKPSNAQRYEVDMNIRNIGSHRDNLEGTASKNMPSPTQGDYVTPLNNSRTTTPFQVGGVQPAGYDAYNQPNLSGYQNNYMNSQRGDDRQASPYRNPISSSMVSGGGYQSYSAQQNMGYPGQPGLMSSTVWNP